MRSVSCADLSFCVDGHGEIGGSVDGGDSAIPIIGVHLDGSIDGIAFAGDFDAELPIVGAAPNEEFLFVDVFLVDHGHGMAFAARNRDNIPADFRCFHETFEDARLAYDSHLRVRKTELPIVWISPN